LRQSHVTQFVVTEICVAAVINYWKKAKHAIRFCGIEDYGKSRGCVSIKNRGNRVLSLAEVIQFSGSTRLHT
jgi:hypothetical protein